MLLLFPQQDLGRDPERVEQENDFVIEMAESVRLANISAVCTFFGTRWSELVEWQDRLTDLGVFNNRKTVIRPTAELFHRLSQFEQYRFLWLHPRI